MELVHKLTLSNSYTPSTALAVLGVVLFAISALWHSYQIYRWRTFYFIPVAVGCIMEVIGYTFRLLSSTKSPYNVDWYGVMLKQRFNETYIS